MPPVGEHWDNDDGVDWWGSDSKSESEQESPEGDVVDTYASPTWFNIKST